MKKIHRFLLVVLLAFGIGQTNITTASQSLTASSHALVVQADVYGAVTYQLTGTWTATITFEGSINGTWVSLPAFNTTTGAIATTATANGVYQVSSLGFYQVRARVSAYTSGTVSAIARATGQSSSFIPTSITPLSVGGQVADGSAISGNPVSIGGIAINTDPAALGSSQAGFVAMSLTRKLVALPHALPGERWSYAAASGGIINTTAVTIKAAVASQKNCITSMQVTNGHATVGTAVSIRDGASGTVIWRGYAYQAGGNTLINFPVPLCGTTNTLLEVVAATTGSAVYVNAQGYEGAE